MLRILLSLLFLVSTSASAKSLEEIISKARSYVGPEEKIDSVESLLYEGILKPVNGGPERKISLLLEKPANQRLIISQGEGQITMVVNSREGFMEQKNLTTGESAASPLPTDQVLRFKANAAENLFFFDFPPGLQVRSKYLGEQEFRGETVDAVRYIHPGGIIFFRYFDPETGELIGTMTDTGTINTEEGEIAIDGLRFSDTVFSYEGGELIHSITFDSITVNPEIPAGAFAFPDAQ